MGIIQPTGSHDAEIVASIVSQGNKDVAEKFEFTLENNPKHPYFHTKELVQSDMERSEEYFLYQNKGVNCGCVTFEQHHSDISYLNRLSVLPGHRHKGIGEQLVKHVLEYSRTKNNQMLRIGIITEHTLLKKWYLKLGFIEKETEHFDSLSFDVRYMR